MRFLSICSGIEAASVAFHPLGWQALALAEIEPFPCSLLAHHYPQVPNLGDLTRWREWSPQLLAQADVLCGGTPCQAFSVAGLRGSLSDERGNLTLTFCHLYDEIDHQRHLHGRSPAVCLWENVPGVLNTPDNAFGHFLAGLAGENVPLTPPGARWTDAGYVRGPKRAVAWRVLDAQYFGLAQRRERVFVVASADPAFDPAAVLFEFAGLRRDTPPRRGPGEGTAHELAPSLTSSGRGVERPGESRGQDPVIAEWMPNAGVPEVANCLTRRMHKGLNTTLDEGQTPIVEVTHALRGEGFDASEDGTGRGTPIVPELFAFSSKDHGADASQDLSPTLRAGNHAGSHANGGNPPAIAFPERLSGTQCASAEDVSPVLQAQNPTAVAYEAESEGQRAESFAFDLRGREGGAMPEGPHATANLRAGSGGSGGSSRSYVAQKAEPGVLPFDTTQITSKTGDPCHPLAAGAHAPSIAFAIQERAVCENLKAGPDGVGVRADDCAYTLEARQVPQAVAFNIHSANSCAMRSAGESQAALETELARAVDTQGFSANQGGTVALSEVAQPLRSNPRNNSDPTMEATMRVLSLSPSLKVSPSGSHWRVRRLTPEECELLQGFPIGYTLIPGASSKKRKGDDLRDTIDYLISLGVAPAEAEVLAHSPDGPRYKALGNSWAVPVARWIARRIDACAKALSRQ
jgi:DNA (cytosine-5)-methyltransferase 1